MNTKELLHRLQKEAKLIRSSDFLDFSQSQTDTAEPETAAAQRNRLLRNYNFKAFLELEGQSGAEVNDSIQSEALDEFVTCVDRYMDEYAPSEAIYRRYIRVIALYLAFIAKRPLHPVGMRFAEGMQVTCESTVYTCPIKSEQESLSLCKFCICKRAI